MSLLGRIKNALSAKANAALDKAIAPDKEMDLVIAELEETNREAKKELLAYKTTEKQIKQDLEALEQKIARWEKRAMEAVRSGNDELAKEALVEKRRLESDRRDMIRDRNEAAAYAVELNRNRKKVETRLQILKLKKGTMAQQIASARSASGPFGDDKGVWERMARAEERIEEEAIAAEVDELLGMEDAESRDALAALEAQSKTAGTEAELAALKARMATDRKQLRAKPDDSEPK